MITIGRIIVDGNQTGVNVFLIAFFLLPPVLLGAKAGLKWRLSSWWFLGGFLPVGWVLINLATTWHFDELARLHDPRATADGAALVFSFMFGWIYAALYFGLWLAVYRLPTCLSFLSRSRPIQGALLLGALFSFYVLGVYVRSRYGMRVVVQNNREMVIEKAIVRVAGQSYNLVSLNPGQSEGVFLGSVTESSVTLQFRDSHNQEHEETILTYVEAGYCGVTTATIFPTYQVTSQSDYDVRCLKSWLGFF